MIIYYDFSHLLQRNINQTMIQSDDFVKAAVAQATKSDAPVFSKL